MKDLLMKYKEPAEDSLYGWENESLPIGNGYVGANVFGIVERERIQITHNALVNPNFYEGKNFGGLNNFAEIYIEFPHNSYTEYERGLSLNNAAVYCKYSCNGVRYKRNYFASYVDKVVVLNFSSSEKGKLNFEIKPHIPYVKEYALKIGDGGGKSGSIEIDNDTIYLVGKLDFYNVRFEGQIKVISDGITAQTDNGICVKNAAQATLIFAADTNYELCENTFLEKDSKKKIPDINPHETVCEIIEKASGFEYEELKERHINDYQHLFNRVDLSLCDEIPDYVADMMQKYSNGENVPCLEELYFQYGRYLLISSSRKGGLPANLQGIWNCHEFSPWGSGYWHNINVQMNYWPAFNTNLLETFEPYIDFYKAYRKKAEEFASEYIKEHNPENYTEKQGECGWTIGTTAYPYFITAPGGHSGPGTGALTSKLFWEMYAFSGDKKVLRDITYPALLGMSKFLTKTVKDYDGEYLVSFSASPEQMFNGEYVDYGRYYQTVGCAFDQQMIYENGKDLLKAAEILGLDNKTVKIQKEQICHYNPVEIGWSGQIKEFQEEKFYGEIGEYHHRHISHLMALYPGTLINKLTPAWLDAAKLTLKKRGNETTGWALAHRLNAWARTGDGNGAYEVLQKLLSEKTMLNLWDLHPPFQIDGNFGATAGIAEMLIQSHAGFIEILPALPDNWRKGSFKGLLARGGFEVSAKWENGSVKRIEVKSLNGDVLHLKCKNISKATGANFETLDNDTIILKTKKNMLYKFEEIPERKKVPEPIKFEINNSSELTWQSNYPVNIYRATDSQKLYTLIGKEFTDRKFKDSIDFSKHETITYKISNISDGEESAGICVTINHATQKEIDRYINIINS